ncbi:MAG: adenylate/guanylate cyclase domain-containing protein, partial [candidate division Zixibacteria bacterium]|nr:adenylate/guanylate cyclase domain-containing protein [candidate division Zixibacteria bacterium]
RINQITNAAERVTQGDLTIHIDDERHDELGRLARAFNQMVGNLNNLHQSRDLLSRTMSPAVRQSLIERGLDFRGITQPVSILFIDIKGFTQITEKYNTEQVVFFLNDYYSSIANQVHAGGGIIGKYGGDSIMAFFGAPDPEPSSKSSTAALLTALALQEIIEGLSERWMVLDMPPIRVGMGISTGPVVAGPIGSTDQFEYTVIGDAVNLAARLQGLTRTILGYGIILDATTYELLEEKVKLQFIVIGLKHYETLDDKEKARMPVQLVDFGRTFVRGKKGQVHIYGIPDYDPELESKSSESERLAKASLLVTAP